MFTYNIISTLNFCITYLCLEMHCMYSVDYQCKKVSVRFVNHLLEEGSTGCEETTRRQERESVIHNKLVHHWGEPEQALHN